MVVAYVVPVAWLRRRAQLLREEGQSLGPVVSAFGEMPKDVYVIAEAVAKGLATEHRGFYSDKKQGVVAAPLLS